jgi:hypothetical protein
MGLFSLTYTFMSNIIDMLFQPLALQLKPKTSSFGMYTRTYIPAY